MRPRLANLLLACGSTRATKKNKEGPTRWPLGWLRAATVDALNPRQARGRTPANRAADNGARRAERSTRSSQCQPPEPGTNSKPVCAANLVWIERFETRKFQPR